MGNFAKVQVLSLSISTKLYSRKVREYKRHLGKEARLHSEILLACPLPSFSCLSELKVLVHDSSPVDPSPLTCITLKAHPHPSPLTCITLKVLVHDSSHPSPLTCITLKVLIHDSSHPSPLTCTTLKVSACCSLLSTALNSRSRFSPRFVPT